MQRKERIQNQKNGHSKIEQEKQQQVYLVIENNIY